MTHAYAPLTPEGRMRLVQRCQSRPIAHVAAEAGLARATVTRWVLRFEEYGRDAPMDISSAPRFQPTRCPQVVVDRIENPRRPHKWAARQIHLELIREGHRVSRVTVGRWLRHLGTPGAGTSTPPAQRTKSSRRSWPAAPAT